jgi:nucleoside-diphosphate-sugar epimerase
MTKILLLGGSGFLGQSLLRKLEQKNSVKLMIHNSNLQTNAQKFNGDILSKNSFIHEIRDDQIIINLLGQITSNESDLIDSNILGGLNLLNSCIDKKIKHIILISSINVYGENLERPSKEIDPLHPKTTYGIVKMITERIYRQFSETNGINVTVLRLADIYGPNKKNGFLTQIINSLNDKTIVPVCYNDGKQQRDMLYIDDAIDCILNVINNPHHGFNSFNVSSGKRYSINELISKIEKISKSKLIVNYSSEIPDEKCIWADNEKAKKILKFEPKIDIEIGLKSTIDHVNSKK